MDLINKFKMGSEYFPMKCRIILRENPRDYPIIIRGNGNLKNPIYIVGDSPCMHSHCLYYPKYPF